MYQWPFRISQRDAPSRICLTQSYSRGWSRLDSHANPIPLSIKAPPPPLSNARRQSISLYSNSPNSSSFISSIGIFITLFYQLNALDSLLSSHTSAIRPSIISSKAPTPLKVQTSPSACTGILHYVSLISGFLSQRSILHHRFSLFQF